MPPGEEGGGRPRGGRAEGGAQNPGGGFEGQRGREAGSVGGEGGGAGARGRGGERLETRLQGVRVGRRRLQKRIGEVHKDPSVRSLSSPVLLLNSFPPCLPSLFSPAWSPRRCVTASPAGSRGEATAKLSAELHRVVKPGRLRVLASLGRGCATDSGGQTWALSIPSILLLLPGFSG